jgi:predicted nucleotidyltransferase
MDVVEADFEEIRRDHAALLIRAARADTRVTQSRLAAEAGIPRSTIAAYESGHRRPSDKTLKHILAAAHTRPSIAIAIFATEIRAAAAHCGLHDVRIFGSVQTGRDTDRSDIDLLVRTGPKTSLFDLGSFALAVEALTGFDVDVVTDTQVKASRLGQIIESAVMV